MRHWILALSLLVGSVPHAAAQVSFSGAISGISIGINLPVYPEFVQISGYPVYYAPRVPTNYFFYDGLYWVYQNDNWYASSWYNGPWWVIPPAAVPVFILQIPVRYYKHPPHYFRNWHPEAAPRWGEHWGPVWEQQRGDWNRGNPHSQHRAAPLPSYQNRFPAHRYPSEKEQRRLQEKNYRHRPSDPEVRQQFEAHREHGEGNRGGHGKGR